MTVSGLPPNTDFDFFVIQVPNAPFGLSWYQGDIETGRAGIGNGIFVGRFNIETFIVAPGAAPAPMVHSGPPDASLNPPTNPVRTRSTSGCGSTRPRTRWRPGARQRHAVQRRARRRHPGTEHAELAERPGPAP